jgi:hypothetical protein
MSHEIPPNDPRLMWQSQKREHPVMSSEEIRIRAEVAQEKVRRNLITAFSAGFVVLALCAIFVATSRSTPLRLLVAGLMLLTVEVIYKAYARMWRRHRLEPDTAFQGCLNFYRQELQSQYQALQLTWLFLVPVVAFAFLLWNGLFRGGASFVRALLPFLLLLILVERRRERRRINRKLMALDEFEKEDE